MDEGKQGDCLSFDRGLPDLDSRENQYVVISQTCDLVRAGAEKVQLVAIEQLDGNVCKQARRGKQPRYVHVGWLKDCSFANLSHVSTVDVTALDDVQLLARVGSHTERRTFGRAIGRYYSRAALPDELNDFLKPMADYLVKRSGKNSLEGEIVSTLLQEIRVHFEPSEKFVELTLLIDDTQLEDRLDTEQRTRAREMAERGGASIAQAIEAATRDPSERLVCWAAYGFFLEGKLQATDAYANFNIQVVGLANYSYSDHLDTDRIDIDYLSGFLDP